MEAAASPTGPGKATTTDMKANPTFTRGQPEACRVVEDSIETGNRLRPESVGSTERGPAPHCGAPAARSGG